MRLNPLICCALLLAISDKAAWAAPYQVAEAPLTQVSADLAAGRATSVDVTKAYIDRIKTLDPALHAVILIAPDALEQAAASDKRRAAGKTLGALDGVPILLKDNIDAVGMPTTAGSFALEKNFPARDSEVVRRLRLAGAVILGKANTSQYAGFRSTKGFNGSTVGGSPRNPYDLTRTPAGSSSGPGIAAAVSFAAATVGTETSGSIVGPSNVNGVVGLKPTIALVSRRGIVPISLTQDTAGPMARTVADAAMLLTALAGSDAGDAWSKGADAHKADYLKGLDPNALKGKRLGIMRDLRGYSEDTRPLFDAALKVLAAQGAELVEIPAGAFTDVGHDMWQLLTYDFKEDLNAYLATTPATVKTRTLADLIAFDRTDPREKMHGQEVFEAAEATTGGRKNPDYIKKLEQIDFTTRAGGIDRLLKQYDVSALVTVTGGPAQKLEPDGTGRSHPLVTPAGDSRQASITVYAAVAGYPHLTVPMGQVQGMPVGISFVGPVWSEQRLLSFGYAYEQGSHMRKPPPPIPPVAPPIGE